MSGPENDGWIRLADEMPPSPSPKLIVTNNINSRDAHGHMSHLWLVDMVHVQSDGEFTAFYSGYSVVHNLSHWRYAVPSEAPDLASREVA